MLTFSSGAVLPVLAFILIATLRVGLNCNRTILCIFQTNYKEADCVRDWRFLRLFWYVFFVRPCGQLNIFFKYFSVYKIASTVCWHTSIANPRWSVIYYFFCWIKIRCLFLAVHYLPLCDFKNFSQSVWLPRCAFREKRFHSLCQTLYSVTTKCICVRLYVNSSSCFHF